MVSRKMPAIVNDTSLKDLYDLKVYEKRTLDFGTFAITVQRRASDWWACLNGNESDWNCGKTLDFTVGYMVLTHYSNNVFKQPASKLESE